MIQQESEEEKAKDMLQAVSRSHTGIRRGRWRATRKRGEETWESTHDGLAASQAPAPGSRQASRCKRRCLGRVGSPKTPPTDLRQGLLGRGVADSRDVGPRRGQHRVRHPLAPQGGNLHPDQRDRKQATTRQAEKLATQAARACSPQYIGPQVRRQRRPEKPGANHLQWATNELTLREGSFSAILSPLIWASGGTRQAQDLGPPRA